MAVKTTKAQALQLFREVYADYLKENRGDKVAIRTAWNDYTDALMKDGLITEYQNDNWSQPF